MAALTISTALLETCTEPVELSRVDRERAGRYQRVASVGAVARQDQVAAAGLVTPPVPLAATSPGCKVYW